MTEDTETPGVARQRMQDEMLRAQVEQEKSRAKLLNAQVFLMACLALMVPLVALCTFIWFLAEVVLG